MEVCDASDRRVAPRHSPGLVHRLNFETSCENPRSELEGICRFLGLAFSEAMLRRPEAGSVHTLGGSPSRFEAPRLEITLDRAYEDAFSPGDLRRMRAVVGREAGRWGY